MNDNKPLKFAPGRWGGMVVLLCAVWSLCAYGAEPIRQVRFDIPAQALSPALIQFSSQTNLQIITKADDVSGHLTSGVRGLMPVDAGLKQLLQGTGFSYVMVGDDTVEISAADPRQTSTNETVLRVAQSGPQSAVSSDAEHAQNPDSAKNTYVQEIIVTAQKRTQRLMDVPMSISAISADEIDRRGLVKSEDYLRGIPGVNQVGNDSGYQGQAIVIRGIETNITAQNFGSGATVATYFGETPTTSTAGLLGSNVDIKLVDIERVEVLRGPQGTAFGSSSLGGVVRSIPVAPKLDRFEGKVGTGYSATAGNGGDNYDVQAIGNIPLIDDKLGIRATVYRYRDSGFYSNAAGSNAAFRAATVTPFGAQAVAIDQREVGSTDATGGRIAALFRASDDLRFTVSYLRQKTEQDGRPLANSGTYEQTQLQVAPEHAFRGERSGLNDTDVEIVNGTVEYGLGWAQLLATYSNISGENVFATPSTASGVVWPGSTGGVLTHRENNAEVRLSTNFSGAWNFLAGVYLEKLHDVYDYNIFWSGNPAAVQSVFVAAPAGQRLLFSYHDGRELEQKAAFGEISWELMPRLTLTGGARSYKYDRTIAVDQSGPLVGNVRTLKNDRIETPGEIFRANLSYKSGDTALVYAGWSQGFRIGKPQTAVPVAACDINPVDGLIDGTSVTVDSSKSIDPDSVDSYELGGKFALLDRRLSVSAAVFRMDWSDIPVSVRYASCNYLQTVNAGAARSEGAELQASFQLSDASRIDFGGSVIHAELTEDVPAQGFLAGNRLPGSPEVNANLGLQHDFGILGHQVSLRADTIYVGSFFGDLKESANSEAGDYIKVDASARVEFGNLNLGLFVKNLTNEDAFSHRASGFTALYGYRLRPRTIGIQLGYRF